MEPTNEDRVVRGQSVMDAFMDLHPDYSDALLRSQEALTDMLSDLRHACKDDGLDFDAAVFMSEIHFETESVSDL